MTMSNLSSVGEASSLKSPPATSDLAISDLTDSNLTPWVYDDPAWNSAAVEAAEESITSCFLAGVGQVGWMTSWPRLETYCEFEQLRSLVLRGFKAIVVEMELGVGQAAALSCGKPIVMARLQDVPIAVQDRLLALVVDEPLGPRVELTAERQGVVTEVVRSVLTAEDWLAIALAAAAQVQRRVMGVV
jgi:hypothetical protein